MKKLNQFQYVNSLVLMINEYIIRLIDDSIHNSKVKGGTSYLRHISYHISLKPETYSIKLITLEKYLKLMGLSFDDLLCELFSECKVSLKRPLSDFKNTDLLPLLKDIPDESKLRYRIQANAPKNSPLSLVYLCEASYITGKMIPEILYEIEQNLEKM